MYAVWAQFILDSYTLHKQYIYIPCAVHLQTTYNTMQYILSAGTEDIQYTSNKRIYAVYAQYTK